MSSFVPEFPIYLYIAGFRRQFSSPSRSKTSLWEGEENFVGDSEIIALGGASNETKDRPLG